MFFDIEKTMHGGDLPDSSQGAHIFVSGLARSGTTLLMRMLHDTSAFASLTYRDMPLVMAPNLWKKIGGAFQKSMARRERAHGDGLEVDYDSPEALEEVFWRTYCAPTVGVEWRGPETLFDPVANVRLGIAYLRQLERKYGVAGGGEGVLKGSAVFTSGGDHGKPHPCNNTEGQDQWEGAEEVSR